MSEGKVTVFKFKAVTCPVLFEVTLSTAVNVAPAAGLAVEVVSDLLVRSWFNTTAVALPLLVKYVPPATLSTVPCGAKAIIFAMVAFVVPPPAAGDKGIKSPVAGAALVVKSWTSIWNITLTSAVDVSTLVSIPPLVSFKKLTVSPYETTSDPVSPTAVHLDEAAGKVTVLRFKAVTWPVEFVVTLSTAVKPAPYAGEAALAVSVLEVRSWLIVTM